MDLKIAEMVNEITDGLDRDECMQVALEMAQVASMIKLKVSDWRGSGNLLPFQQPRLFPEFWWN